MVAIQNGRLPMSMLTQAANGAPGQLLEFQTARQWAAMVAGAARDGITLRPQVDGGVSSCYRDYDNQEHAKQVDLAGGPTAADPGYSNHGLGIAIDIYMGPGVFAWLSANAARYGFDNRQGQATYPPENWHWVRTVLIANISNTITSEEDDMPTMNEFLNFPAFDGGPTISEMFVEIHNISAYLYSGKGASVQSGQTGKDFDPKSAMGRLDSLQAAVFTGGTSMKDGGKSISQSLAEINAKE